MRQQVPMSVVWLGLLWGVTIGLALWWGTNMDVPRHQLQLFKGAILGCIGMVWKGYQRMLRPMLRGRRAVCFGRYTQASVAERTIHTKPDGDVVKLLLFFESAACDYEQLLSLRVPRQGHWIYDIAVGAPVHVLLHPDKPQILMTVGPVHTETRGRISPVPAASG